MTDVNVVSIVKQDRKILTQSDNILCPINKAKYFKNNSNFLHVAKVKNAFPTWRHILEIRYLIDKGSTLDLREWKTLSLVGLLVR